MAECFKDGCVEMRPHLHGDFVKMSGAKSDIYFLGKERNEMGENVLTRTESVLELTAISPIETYHSETDESFPDLAIFACPDREESEENRTYHSDRVFKLDGESWRDMGMPETITVTVVPGDHLNK